MAVITVIAARDMSRVFSDGQHTVMTGSAGAEDLCVIDRCDGSEDVRRVAVLTNIRRLDVCWRFANGVGAIVAIEAVAHDIYMIEVRG